jgi:hypothetical protein
MAAYQSAADLSISAICRRKCQFRHCFRISADCTHIQTARDLRLPAPAFPIDLQPSPRVDDRGFSRNVGDWGRERHLILKELLGNLEAGCEPAAPRLNLVSTQPHISSRDSHLPFKKPIFELRRLPGPVWSLIERIELQRAFLASQRRCAIRLNSQG